MIQLTPQRSHHSLRIANLGAVHFLLKQVLNTQYFALPITRVVESQ